MTYTGITGFVPGPPPANQQGIGCASNLDLSGIQPPGQPGNCYTADGQLWIGSTSLTAGGTNSKIGTLTAGTGITITNGSGSITIASSAAATDLHVARFIVASSTAGTGANFTTIASAIAAAQGTGINSTVFIQPGTYKENITLVAGINLCAFDCDSLTPNVIIQGKLSFSSAGTVSISGVQLQTNSDFFLTVTGSAASIVNLNNCFLNCFNNTGISYTSSSGSSQVNIGLCSGNIGTTLIGLFSASSSGTLKINSSSFTNRGNTVTASTMSAGTLNVNNCYFEIPFTTSGTNLITAFANSLVATNGQNSICITAGGSGTNTVNNCVFNSGTASAISISSTLKVLNCSIASQNTNVITGIGTLSSAGISFYDTSSLINTTTQVPFILTNDAVKVTTPGAYPYTTIPQDAVILVDTTSARVITPLASPTTGQMHRIKDNTGTAAAHNITVTPSGKNIDGAASYVINTNYGSIDICYNGTQWNVL